MDFAEIGRWQEEGLNTVPTAPGSLLYGVDAVTEPYQVSHHIGHLLHTAVDHLHTLTVLMGQAGAQHTFAPYTLIRAAIENASTALWILQPNSPQGIAHRSLKLEYADLLDLKRANESVDPTAGHDEVRLEVFRNCLSRYGWKEADIKPRPPGPLKIIQEASTHFEVPGAPVMWQMCSAAAHGRRWAREYLTLFEGEDDGLSKVLSGRLVSDENSIAMALHLACGLVRKLKTVQEAVSRNPLHRGTSFGLQVVQPRLFVPH